MVHFVLKGEGSVQSEHGIVPLRQGMVAVAPKNVAKQLNGRGPVATVQDLGESCPLAPGIVNVRASSTTERESLTVACAVISATVGEGPDLFDHLRQPLVEQPRSGALPHLFAAMLTELLEPDLGTKAIVAALMKQCLVLLLRKHLKRVRSASSTYLPLLNPKLAPALQAMIQQPQEAHSVDSLAKLSGMSRSSFNRYFRQNCAAAPMEFLQTVRLNEGARLLRRSSLPVKAVAGAVGFASRSHFSRAFHQVFGVDPSAYREAEDPK